MSMNENSAVANNGGANNGGAKNGGSKNGGAQNVVVQKFGGTSVASPERIRAAAARVVALHRAGKQVAVVVSAMAGETNALSALARELGGATRSSREADMLLATGEQKSSALLSLAIQNLGVDARSLTGAQMGLRTNAQHEHARIEAIDAARIRALLDAGSVAVLAGFQGVSDDGEITTLGRGGSDTTAVAVACALGATHCEIYTDVDGVFTADPRVVPAARKLDRIAYNEMIELASLGSKVLQIRSVKFAMHHALPVHVRSSFSAREGTWLVREEDVKRMEREVVSGVTYNRQEAKIRVSGVADEPGVAARLFGPLAAAGIVVDMILQNVSVDATTDMTFTVPRGEFARAMEIAKQTSPALGSGGATGDDTIAKVSVVGLGMKDHAGVAAKMFEVLAREKINIQMISTSEIKISVVIDEAHTERAARALHGAFIEAGATAPVAE